MLRKVLHWPDYRLKQISEPVLEFDVNLHALVKDMYDTLNVTMGAGLAAPQINVHKRVVLIRCSAFGWSNPDPYESDSDICVFVNPQLELSEAHMLWEEGCLSIPGNCTGKVWRKEKAVLKYQDIKGDFLELLLPWPISGGLQHECDHLDGILFIDRMGKRASKEIKKRIRRFCRVPDLNVKKPRREKELIDTRLTHGPGKRKKKRRKK